MKTYETRRESLWRESEPMVVGPNKELEKPWELLWKEKPLLHTLLTEAQVDALIARCAAEGWRPWHMDARNVWFVREVAT